MHRTFSHPVLHTRTVFNTSLNTVDGRLHTHAHTHTRTHIQARTHTRPHARTHARPHEINDEGAGVPLQHGSPRVSTNYTSSLAPERHRLSPLPVSLSRGYSRGGRARETGRQRKRENTTRVYTSDMH